MYVKAFFLGAACAANALSIGIEIERPAGGETFTPGQTISVKWTGISVGSDVSASYSVNNGVTWSAIGKTTADSMPWTIPGLKKTSTQSLVRVVSVEGIDTFRAVSKAPFTIQAVPADAYEPNNDTATAFAVSIADSAVKNAAVFGSADSTDTAKIDVDYFKFKLEGPQQKTAVITAFPCTPDGNGGYTYGGPAPQLTVWGPYMGYIASGPGRLLFSAPKWGTYYCKVSTRGGVCNYGLSVRYDTLKATISSPNASETFSGGQKTWIRWTKDKLIRSVTLQYYFRKGGSWDFTTIGHFDSTSCLWTVPHLKQGADSLLIRVIPDSVPYAVTDVSDGMLKIQPSAPDAYEPNDNFESAVSVGLGDSTVKNAIAIGGFDTLGTDTANYDQDYFKVVLSAGKATTITAVPWYHEDKFNALSFGAAEPTIRIADSLRQKVASGTGKVLMTVSVSGTYYVIISSPARKWTHYGLSILQSGGAASVSLLAPNGGENLLPGQKATARWTKDGPVKTVALALSLDNGRTWRDVGFSDSTAYTWTVPHLKQKADSALFKAYATTDSDNPPSDVSNGTFGIAASAPDAYEPNNDFQSAYAVNEGDSVVRNAVVIENGTPDTIDTSRIDADFYKVSLAAGKMVTVTALPYAPEGTGPFSFGNCVPRLRLYGAGKTLVASDVGSCAFSVSGAGVYFIKVASVAGGWSRYGLSIKTATIIASQISVVDTHAIQKTVTPDSTTYKVQVTADTTKVSVNVTLTEKVEGSITTVVLAPQDFASATGTKAKVTAVSVSADSAFESSIKTVDIAIPYSPADLGGNPEKNLTVMWLSDSTNKWVSVPFTLDTAKNLIIAHTTHFSIYGVFIKAATPVCPRAPLARTVVGVAANYLPAIKAIALHVSLPGAGKAEFSLFNIMGKCVGKSAFATMDQGSSTVLWNVGPLAKGRYFLGVKAGAFSVRRTVFIMN